MRNRPDSRTPPRSARICRREGTRARLARDRRRRGRSHPPRHLSCTNDAPETDPSMPKLSYPTTERGPQVDDYHGTQVADPYRWLEDLDGDSVQRLGHDAEPGVASVPRLTPGTDRDREATDRALELRAPRRSLQEGRSVLLAPQRRAAEPGRADGRRRRRRRAARADRPQRLEQRRQVGAGGVGGQSTTGGWPPTRAPRAAPTGATGE